MPRSPNATDYVGLSRRQFLTTVGLGAAAVTTGSCTPRTVYHSPTPEEAARLDAAVTAPVLRRELFSEPVIIESVELLRYEGSFICRVRSTRGAEGLSVSNNLRMAYLYPIFQQRVAPFFIGKDARDLDRLVDEVWRYRSNYKFQSYALGVPVATVEFALLDLLGRMAGRPIGALLGPIVEDMLQVIRPDMFYFGGMIRATWVARLAAVRGRSVVPHLSGSGLGYLYLLHYVSATPNAGPFHSFSKQEHHPIPIACDTASLEVVDGYVEVPSGPGSGVRIDPGFLDKHQVIK